jgi:hypothetical protein
LLKVKFKTYVILIPLVLSAVTHLWNVAGFPALHPDESDYLRKSVHYLKGFGPQETSNDPIAYPDYPYTHPYFGQLFLAGLLGVTGYPNSLHPTPDVQSIEMLHLVPRAIMGVLAVLDTFLLYKITERRYNKNAALIASVLFAVMPMTWILRRIYLDTLLMPLLLSSILFAIYIRAPNNNSTKQWPTISINKNVLVILSGIFLGLAIYTKVPAFTMIPLVGYLVVSNSKSNRKKTLALWLIPVLLIPLLWPAYAFSIGEFNTWLNSVMFQQGRASSGTGENLFTAFKDLFKIDPISIILGIIGLVFVGLRKDIWLILWIIPLLLFSYYLGWVQYFHLIPIFPAFCIGGALAILSISGKIKKKNASLLIPIILTSGIAVFGFTATTLLITKDVNSGQFDIYSGIASNLADANGTNITLIGSHWWDWNSYWITQYILDQKHDVFDAHFDPQFRQEVNKEKILFVDDAKFIDRLERNIRGENIREIRSIHDNSTIVGSFLDNVTSYDNGKYPYNIMSIMILNENHPVGEVTLRRNY